MRPEEYLLNDDDTKIDAVFIKNDASSNEVK